MDRTCFTTSPMQSYPGVCTVSSKMTFRLFSSAMTPLTLSSRALVSSSTRRNDARSEKYAHCRIHSTQSNTSSSVCDSFEGSPIRTQSKNVCSYLHVVNDVSSDVTRPHSSGRPGRATKHKKCNMCGLSNSAQHFCKLKSSTSFRYPSHFAQGGMQMLAMVSNHSQ